MEIQILPSVLESIAPWMYYTEYLFISRARLLSLYFEILASVWYAKCIKKPQKRFYKFY